MRPFYRFLFAVLASFATSNMKAQITLENTDVTDIGDVITRHIDTIPSYGPGNEGAGQLWDFSSAVIEDTAVTYVSAVSSTPYSSTFGSSSYAMHGIDPSYLYFTETAQQFITDGAAGDLLGTGEILEVPFSDPLILHQFPRDFGDTHNDTYGFQAEADGASFGVYAIRLTHTGHVYDTTDAYGTLVTPFGTYDALRVKTVDFTTDVIETKLASFLPWIEFSTEIDTAVSYSWHAKEEMLAIAEMNFDSIGNPRQFVFSTVPPVNTVAVSKNEQDELTIYPQPASEVLFIKGLDRTGDCTVELMTLDGRVLSTEIQHNGTIDVSTVPVGIYLLRVQTKGSTITRKIIVQHQ